MRVLRYSPSARQHGCCVKRERQVLPGAPARAGGRPLPARETQAAHRVSYRDYESCLDKLARYFADLEIEDLEPPVGTERLEEFLEAQWGESAGRTYNKNLSILRDFFKFQVLRGKLHGDPTLPIDRARKRDVYRTTFTNDQVRAIVAAQEELRDRVAVRLLLNYGLRKGALKAIQFKHFDHHRKRLTVFTKGQKVRDLPIPHPAFWFDLERLILDVEAQPAHYLMQRQKTHPVRFEHGKAVEYRVRRWPDEPMGDHGLHDWWYALPRAGRDRRARDDERRADAQGPAHRRAARARRDREPEGRRSCSGTRRSRRPVTCTRTGTSTSSRTRCGPSWRAASESFPPP